MSSTRKHSTGSNTLGIVTLDPVLFQRIIVVLIFLVVALRATYLFFAAWDFNTDDAYITLRYARQFAEGNGIVWNVGEEPVEGYSNFLVVILGAAAIKLDWDPMLILKVLSCLALGISMGLLYRLSRIWLGVIGAALPAVILSTYVGTIWWTVSGMETAIYQAIVLAAVAAFFQGLGTCVGPPCSKSVRTAWSGRWLALTGLLVFLAALTRPEAPIVGLVLGATLMLDIVRRAVACKKASSATVVRQLLRRGMAMAVVLALSFAVPYGLYFAVRYGHFGRLLPNTVYCKAGFAGDPMTLIHAFWFMARPAFLLAIFALWRPLDLRIFALVLIILSYILVLYGVDPIIGYMNRHFLTAWALLLILTSVGLLYFCGLVLPRVSRPLREFAVVILLVGYTCYYAVDDAALLRTKANLYAQRMDARQDLAHWLNSRLAPQDTFAIGDVGIVSYLSHAKLLDVYCLNCTVMTRPPINRSKSKFVDYLLAERPEIIVVHSKYAEKLEPRTEYGVYPLLLQREAFTDGYQFVRTFGAGFFNYWIFERVKS